MFAGIFLINSHLLLTEPPTHCPEITGKYALAKHLKPYQGTGLLVFYDRDLIESVYSQWMAISEGKIDFLADADRAYALLRESGKMLRLA